MAVTSRLADAARALLGISTYDKPTAAMHGVSLDDPTVRKIRESMGGQLQPLPRSKPRWFLADLEDAQLAADRGDLSRVGQLGRSIRRDGLINGLMSTRTAGLVALPKRWRGDGKQIEALQSEAVSRSVFDEMCPASELALMAADGITCGVGIGELLPVVGRRHPVLVRYEPEFLKYFWTQNQWYYQTIAGMVPVTPGDGRWVLHTPGGRVGPWNNASWPALGRAFIDKEHAMLHRSNYGAKLANPARVAHAPAGAVDVQRLNFLAQLIAWGVNSVFELPAGWDVKLLESNGRGWEVFKQQIETADYESMITLAGQVVTVTGGTGFANADIHQTIKADLIKQTGDALAHTLNTQVLPPWVYSEYGPDALKNIARLTWDTDPPKDKTTEAKSMREMAGALKELQEALTAHGLYVDALEMARAFGIPLTDKPPEITTMQLETDNDSTEEDASADAASEPAAAD